MQALHVECICLEKASTKYNYYVFPVLTSFSFSSGAPMRRPSASQAAAPSPKAAPETTLALAIPEGFAPKALGACGQYL